MQCRQFRFKEILSLLQMEALRFRLGKLLGQA
jgi:hypothetical protein